MKKNEELKTTEKKEDKEFNEFKKYVERSNKKIIVVLKGVSRSGMLRNMDFYSFYVENNKVKKVYLNYYIEKFLRYNRDKNNGTIKVSGCGMNMAFSVVYNIGRLLYPNGDGETITGRNGSTKPETDGGYLMRYEVL